MATGFQRAPANWYPKTRSNNARTVDLTSWKQWESCKYCRKMHAEKIYYQVIFYVSKILEFSSMLFIFLIHMLKILSNLTQPCHLQRRPGHFFFYKNSLLNLYMYFHGHSSMITIHRLSILRVSKKCFVKLESFFVLGKLGANPISMPSTNIRAGLRGLFFLQFLGLKTS